MTTDDKSGPVKPGDIRPAPAPFSPEIQGLVDVVAPHDGEVKNIVDVSVKYVKYSGIGVGFVPEGPQLTAVMSGDLYRDVTKQGAHVFVFKNPTFKSTIFIQAGLFNGMFDNVPEEFPFPKDPNDPRVSRITKGEVFHTMNFEELGKLKMSTMCVILASNGDLKKVMQKIVPAEGVKPGKHVKEGDTLFSFQKLD